MLRKYIFNYLFHPQEGILSFFPTFWKFFVCDRQKVSQLFCWETQKYPVYYAKINSFIL